MMLPYECPVVYFYSEDPEDSEVIQKQGQIEPIRLETEPYEAVVSAEGYSFHILFGSQCNGNFLCIPDWHTGCELAGLTDVFWNVGSISGNDESFNYENATAVAYALKELGQLIKR